MVLNCLVWVLGTKHGSSTSAASVLNHMSHLSTLQIMILDQCLPLANTMKEEDRLGRGFASLGNTQGGKIDNILKLISKIMYAPLGSFEKVCMGP